MRRATKLLCAAAAASALVAVVPSSAAAVPLSCEFHAVGNAAPGMMAVGGSGTFNWDTAGHPLPSRCSPVGPPLVPARIVSNGFFTNVVCGTGTMYSNDTTVTYAGTHRIVYVFDFSAFSGAIDIVSVDGVPDPLPRNGGFTLVPTQGSCASPSGITGFEIHGNFHTF